MQKKKGIEMLIYQIHNFKKSKYNKTKPIKKL